MTTPNTPQSPAAARTAEIVERRMQELLDESERLRVDVHNRAVQQRKATYVALVAVVMALVLLGVQMVILIQNRERSNESRGLIRDNYTASQQIADCTTAGGRCYENGRRQSATALRMLIDGEVEIQNCARKTSSEAELRACVDEALTIMPAPSAGTSAPAAPAPSGTKAP